MFCVLSTRATEIIRLDRSPPQNTGGTAGETCLRGDWAAHAHQTAADDVELPYHHAQVFVQCDYGSSPP